jgi:hypothetical protein
MGREKRIVYDARTGEQRIDEFEFTPPPPPPEPIMIELEEVKKLLDHAKKQKWI